MIIQGWEDIEEGPLWESGLVGVQEVATTAGFLTAVLGVCHEWLVLTKCETLLVTHWLKHLEEHDISKVSVWLTSHLWLHRILSKLTQRPMNHRLLIHYPCSHHTAALASIHKKACFPCIRTRRPPSLNPKQSIFPAATAGFPASAPVVVVLRTIRNFPDLLLKLELDLVNKGLI